MCVCVCVCVCACVCVMVVISGQKMAIFSKYRREKRYKHKVCFNGSDVSLIMYCVGSVTSRNKMSGSYFDLVLAVTLIVARKWILLTPTLILLG